ncbi:hypothetical protein L21SP5_02140 [Salinivirga cyanobacteriivorans]|uniref:Sulfotransferase family protein n=1 Tax=Salinivirga cyanobacteriivorans TaxID=1307839 RepID=A0A0S2I0G8_9BACT|nr:hypothetical protein [Salinivirga cyanobacteriivorans]ALO15773.1 hypothetical protein L21SP5_02140 [Salinivirga cyanobacteriivorans]
MRNPYDWLTSLYYYILEHPEHYLHHRILGQSFEKYIDIQINENNLNTQFAYLSDESGQLIVDYIAKIENIQNELHTITERLNIPFEKLSYLNKTKGRQGKNDQLFNDSIYKLVNQHFRVDFENFNYPMIGADS